MPIEDVTTFTIHYGEIKTILIQSGIGIAMLFTIHYGEIKTTSAASSAVI